MSLFYYFVQFQKIKVSNLFEFIKYFYKYIEIFHLILINSGSSSERINLSPFTKDFRGVEQYNEYSIISLTQHYVG
jgi:hypothetical protein